MDQFTKFIIDHEEADTSRLLLDRNKWPDIDIDLAVNTIEVRRKLRSKVPSWYAEPRLLFPRRLSGEQCSSEQTASYKVSVLKRLFPDTRPRVADLTGGLGVDTWAFAGEAEQVLYNEMNPDLAAAARHNFEVLGTCNIRTASYMVVPAVPANAAVSGPSAAVPAEVLDGFSPDLIFLDPARRNSEGKKVFLLEDCSPDILQLKDGLLACSPFLMVKLSPMADISMVLSRLGSRCMELHILASGGECKELLVLMKRGWEGECTIHAVSGTEDFRFTRQELEEARPVYLPSVAEVEEGDLLFEPGKPLMKAGVFNLLCQRFPLLKLGRSTHYYLVDRTSVSETLLETLSRMGKLFRIKEVHPLNKKSLKEVGKAYPRSEVTARNLPMDSALLKRKMGTTSGDDSHIFGLKCDAGVRGDNWLFVTSRLWRADRD